MGLSAGVACVVVHQIHSSVHHVTHDAICAAGASAARARRARTHPTKTTLVSPPHTRTDAHVSPQPYTTYCVYRPVRPTCPSAASPTALSRGPLIASLPARRTQRRPCSRCCIATTTPSTSGATRARANGWTALCGRMTRRCRRLSGGLWWGAREGRARRRARARADAPRRHRPGAGRGCGGRAAHPARLGTLLIERRRRLVRACVSRPKAQRPADRLAPSSKPSIVRSSKTSRTVSNRLVSSSNGLVPSIGLQRFKSTI